MSGVLDSVNGPHPANKIAFSGGEAFATESRNYAPTGFDNSATTKGIRVGGAGVVGMASFPGLLTSSA